MSPRETFTALTQRTDAITDAELDDFWATLAPATIDFMIGEWAGGEFDTGHRANGFMEREQRQDHGSNARSYPGAN